MSVLDDLYDLSLEEMFEVITEESMQEMLTDPALDTWAVKDFERAWREYHQKKKDEDFRKRYDRAMSIF